VARWLSENQTWSGTINWNDFRFDFWIFGRYLHNPMGKYIFLCLSISFWLHKLSHSLSRDFLFYSVAILIKCQDLPQWCCHSHDLWPTSDPSIATRRKACRYIKIRGFSYHCLLANSGLSAPTKVINRKMLIWFFYRLATWIFCYVL